ncbi:MAG: iron ABC transporter permease [Hespellia sp.]|nr:iron ABC transporter permease [Hespellia sp.]
MNHSQIIRNRAQYLILMGCLCVFLAVSAGISVVLGAVEISSGDIIKIIVNKLVNQTVFVPVWEDNIETIIWNIRVPRVALACIVGAGLSICGVLMQALTKNALADPYVLGISSGASAGAVCSILIGCFRFAGEYATIFGATLGAFLSILLSLRIASFGGKITSTQLILAGIATSALFTALTNLMIYGYHTGSDKTKTAQYWMVGSLSGASWGKVKYAAIAFLVVIVIILLFARELDVLLLGDDVAENLGVETGRIKMVIISMATILTGIVVSISGVIGFIGLVVPHIVRSMVGSRHKYLIPAVLLTGGLFTMLADVASRVIAAPAELPIGIISALIGAPFFLYLIRKNKAR